LETKYRNQITLIGSNVNFPNRLEGVTKNHEILESEEIIKLIKDKFAFESVVREVIHMARLSV
jgi:class 3 adenylate cyclase